MRKSMVFNLLINKLGGNFKLPPHDGGVSINGHLLTEMGKIYAFNYRSWK